VLRSPVAETHLQGVMDDWRALRYRLNVTSTSISPSFECCKADDAARRRQLCGQQLPATATAIKWKEASSRTRWRRRHPFAGAECHGERIGTGKVLRLMAEPLLSPDIQPLQTDAVGRQRVRLDASFHLIAVAVAVTVPAKLPAPQRRPALQHVGKLGEIDGRSDIEAIPHARQSSINALQVRLSHRRAQHQFLNLSPGLVYASPG